MGGFEEVWGVWGGLGRFGGVWEGLGEFGKVWEGLGGVWEVWGSVRGFGGFFSKAVFRIATGFSRSGGGCGGGNRFKPLLKWISKGVWGGSGWKTL